MLSIDNQLYFNALFFPAQGILLSAGFIDQPQLLRLANIWSSPKRRGRFDLIVSAMLGVIALLTGGTLVFMGWIGIPIMSFMYGVDFERYRMLAYLMIAAGGVSASIDFIYAIITVLRHQESAMKPYLITFVFAAVVPTLLDLDHGADRRGRGIPGLDGAAARAARDGLLPHSHQLIGRTARRSVHSGPRSRSGVSPAARAVLARTKAPPGPSARAELASGDTPEREPQHNIAGKPATGHPTPTRLPRYRRTTPGGPPSA